MNPTTSLLAFAGPAHQHAIVIGGSIRQSQTLAPVVDAGQPETALGGD